MNARIPVADATQNDSTAEIARAVGKELTPRGIFH